MQGHMIFKCRLCGEEFCHEKIHHSRVARTILCFSGILKYREKTSQNEKSVRVGNVFYHLCEDGSIGYADFIGIKQMERD